MRYVRCPGVRETRMLGLCCNVIGALLPNFSSLVLMVSVNHLTPLTADALTI